MVNFLERTMMLDSNEIKGLVLNMGTDLCGVATIERFKEAPEGFHPTDVYKKCKSVIVFARYLPFEIITANSRIAYTHGSDTMLREIDSISLEICRQFNKKGIHAVFIPADTPYEYWEPDRLHGQGILSLRHAGELAGLGVLGKNTLLMTKQFGNSIYLGAILVDVILEPDPIVNEELCPKECDNCLKACPQKALNGISVDQSLCRQRILTKNERGFLLVNCNICRKVCPVNVIDSTNK